MNHVSQMPVDDAVADAGILAELLSLATEIVNDLDYSLPDGRRNIRLDRLHGLLFAAEKLGKELVETVDALPRPRANQ